MYMTVVVGYASLLCSLYDEFSKKWPKSLKWSSGDSTINNDNRGGQTRKKERSLLTLICTEYRVTFIQTDKSERVT